ncbi:competence type IV pilus minor pilin ComGG [Lentibacillus salicampi]|uniref:competence type IV pilus minor pilin ComGG n=1 Tax=Lentibacillus salicampi TaxID=175306 RepID=UPI00142F69CA|nr:competence type IV pilus minor pilin ComGG [Lentibacillus salicampi]
MKKTLCFTTDQKGFVLPYVLFFIALAFMIITANVNLYQDETHITQNQAEQLKIGTLLQMARAQFKEDVANRSETDELTYTFPYGDVVVQYTQLNEEMYHLYFSIRTDNGATHTFINRMKTHPE